MDNDFQMGDSCARLCGQSHCLLQVCCCGSQVRHSIQGYHLILNMGHLLKDRRHGTTLHTEEAVIDTVLRETYDGPNTECKQLFRLFFRKLMFFFSSCGFLRTYRIFCCETHVVAPKSTPGPINHQCDHFWTRYHMLTLPAAHLHLHTYPERTDLGRTSNGVETPTDHQLLYWHKN